MSETAGEASEKVDVEKVDDERADEKASKASDASDSESDSDSDSDDDTSNDYGASIEDKPIIEIDPEETIDPNEPVHLASYYEEQLSDRISCMRLTSVPHEVRSEEFYHLIMQRRPELLQFVPYKFRTARVCNAALLCSEWMISDVEPHIPRRYRTQEFYNVLIKIYSREGLSKVPRRFRTYELCLEACEISGENLEDVPPEILDRKICEAAMKHCMEVPPRIPKKFRDIAMYKLLMSYNGDRSEYIPGKYWSNREVRLAAAKNNSDALEFMYGEEIDREMIMAAITCEEDWDHIDPIRYIPEEKMELEFFEPLVRKNASSTLGTILSDYDHLLPPGRTKGTEGYEFIHKLCWIASDNLGDYGFRAIPDEHLDYDLCKAIVKNQFRRIGEIPEARLDRAMYEIAAESGGVNAIKYIPKEFMDEEMQKIIRGSKDFVRSETKIPETFTREDYEALALSEPDAIRKFPPEFRDAEMYLKTLISNTTNTHWGLKCMIENMPFNIFDEKICRALVEIDGLYLAYVPRHLRTQKLYEVAILKDPKAVDLVLDLPKFVLELLKHRKQDE